MAPSAVAYTLPAMQLVCNLVISNTPVWNDSNPDWSTDQTTPAIPTGSLPDGYVAHPEIGAAYKVYNVSSTWMEAREYCLQEGARLVVTDSYLKYQKLMSQAPTATSINVGIIRMYDDVYWVSATTGSIITTVPFANGYPGTNANDCVVAGYSPAGLRNLRCTTLSTMYACELPIQMNYNQRADDQVAEISVN